MFIRLAVVFASPNREITRKSDKIWKMENCWFYPLLPCLTPPLEGTP